MGDSPDDVLERYRDFWRVRVIEAAISGLGIGFIAGFIVKVAIG